MACTVANNSLLSHGHRNRGFINKLSYDTYKNCSKGKNINIHMKDISFSLE